MNPLRSLLVATTLWTYAPFALHAQEPVWFKHYANGGQNSGMRLCWDGEDGLFGIGTLHGDATLDGTEVSVVGSEDILIVRWDSTGNIVWARTAGGDCEPGDTDGGGDIHYEPMSARLITTGYFTCPQSNFGTQILNGSGALSGIQDAFLASYDIDGECQWARRITASPNLWLTSTVTDADGNIFLLGNGETAGATFYGASIVSVPPGGFLAKYSSDGTLIHAERILVNGTPWGTVWADTDEWYLFGSAKPGAALYSQNLAAVATSGDGFVARVDTAGAIQWVTMLHSSISAAVLGSVVLPDGSCVVRGHYRGDLTLPSGTLTGSPSLTNSFIARLDSQGEVQWAVKIGATGRALVYDIEADTNFDLLIYGRFEGDLQIGQTSVSSAGSKCGLLCRLGSDGSLKAATTFARVPYGTGSVLSTNHGCYLSSEFDSTMTLGTTVIQGSAPASGDDLFLARFDSLSGFTNVPTAMALQGGGLVIYANPNEGRATVALPKGLAPGSSLRLVVRDAQGLLVQEVPFIVSERGTVQLDISAQAKGVYHVELADGKQRHSGKIVFE